MCDTNSPPNSPHNPHTVTPNIAMTTCSLHTGQPCLLVFKFPFGVSSLNLVGVFVKILTINATSMDIKIKFTKTRTLSIFR